MTTKQELLNRNSNLFLVIIAILVALGSALAAHMVTQNTRNHMVNHTGIYEVICYQDDRRVANDRSDNGVIHLDDKGVVYRPMGSDDYIQVEGSCFLIEEVE